MATEKININKIPYDAPLGIEEPPVSWVRTMARRGNNTNRLTSASVPDADLTGKWVIISGSNNGIGREAALQMAGWGANLILACRDPPSKETHPTIVVEECLTRAKKAGHVVEVEWWEIDMANLATVEAFAQRWLDTGRPLDILCNNAGIGSSPGGQKIFKTVDGFEIIHQVSFQILSLLVRHSLTRAQINFLSHVLLTLRLLPSLAKAKEPRVICTTSCFHYFGKYKLAGFNGEDNGTGIKGVQLYMNNKLWFQIWLTELQHRLLQHDLLKHITVNGIHPGYVNSGIWNLNERAPVVQFVIKTMAYFLAIDSQQGSLAITNCATCPEGGPNLKLQGVGTDKGLGGGAYFNRIWPDQPMPHTQDRDCRLRVWRKVNDELKLQQKGLLDIIGLEANDV